MSNALRVAKGKFGRVALLDMDRPLVRHAHPHCHVLLKVEGADTQFSVRDDLVPLTGDSAVLINAWEPHAYAHDAMRPRTIILALYIEPSWLGAFRPNWSASGRPDFFAASVGAITPRIRALTDELARAMVAEPAAQALHETLLSQLMIAVIERFTSWREATPSLRELARWQGIDRRIRAAGVRIDTDPGSIREIDELVGESGVSRAQFFRLFEASFGVSPRVYLNVARLERAVKAVSESDMSFATIGETLGFTVPAHFSRFFHDHAGSSPSGFRAVTRMTDDFETSR
ncbi:helix-turn-helix transcriptional regulator [Mangrovicella endophytica]|uniref:helix-turn-helix transcriptional regulator n=1 Tax=Mangrovicella endophytica TaxID=2066697 RepID=UPI000C9E3B35|nr:AraC family transcriptional regulator [Mangrovicella endophytica]